MASNNSLTFNFLLKKKMKQDKHKRTNKHKSYYLTEQIFLTLNTKVYLFAYDYVMSAAEVIEPSTLRVKAQRIAAEPSASVDCFNVSKKRSQNCLIKYLVTLM